MKQRDYLRDGYNVNGVLVILSGGQLLCTVCTTAGVCEHELAIKNSSVRGTTDRIIIGVVEGENDTWRKND